MAIVWSGLNSSAAIRARQSRVAPVFPPAGQPWREAPRRSDAALWSDIRESVSEYCDERAPAGDWHISRDLFSSEALAFNFFFPLRQDTGAMSRALSALRGRRTRLESLDVLPPTMTETMGVSEPRPVSNIVISYRDDAGTGLLLLKCAFSEPDLGACPARTGFSRDGSRCDGAPHAAGCSVASRCPYLQELSGLLEESGPPEARTTCPFAEGGHQVMRGLILARTMVAAWNADAVDFGVIYDRRNAALTSLARLWRSRVEFPSWTYQDILAALGRRNARRMGSWRAFLNERYGLDPGV
jgi:hypothetical protein